MKRALIAAALVVATASTASADPLKFYNGRLFITANVNGVPTEALLDSGAEGSIFDPAFAKQAVDGTGCWQGLRFFYFLETRKSGGLGVARFS